MSFALELDGQVYPVRLQRGPDNRESLIVVHPGDSGRMIASLSWQEYTGEIKFVKVFNPEYRRRGIATALLDIARERYQPKIKHSRLRTSDGDIWARSTGDPLPERLGGHCGGIR